MTIIVRTEKQEDIKAISQVTFSAFMGKFSDNPNEHLIVDGLREAGELFLSLVAEMDGKIIGHVAFSSVTINGENKGWYGLGPVSVLPELQKQGIGSKLIQEGLRIIRERGAKGCVLEGSPEYYQRFGFKPYAGLVYDGAPAPQYFMVLPFHEDVPTGKVEFHRAFYVSSG